jgi:hypothetical protein
MPTLDYRESIFATTNTKFAAAVMQFGFRLCHPFQPLEWTAEYDSKESYLRGAAELELFLKGQVKLKDMKIKPRIKVAWNFTLGPSNAQDIFKDFSADDREDKLEELLRDLPSTLVEKAKADLEDRFGPDYDHWNECYPEATTQPNSEQASPLVDINGKPLPPFITQEMIDKLHGLKPGEIKMLGAVSNDGTVMDVQDKEVPSSNDEIDDYREKLIPAEGTQPEKAVKPTIEEIWEEVKSQAYSLAQQIRAAHGAAIAQAMREVQENREYLVTVLKTKPADARSIVVFANGPGGRFSKFGVKASVETRTQELNKL